MNHAKILPIFLLAIFILILAIACSRDKSPVEPVIDSDDYILAEPVSFGTESENRSVLAVFNAVIDPVKKTFTIEPANRSAEYHYPLTELYPDILQIRDWGLTPNFWADIRLTHPFPGSGIDVFDPRVIAILPANQGNEMNYPVFDIHANNSVVLEPDGYIKLYDNLGGAIPGNANPFIAYFKEQPYRQWSSVQPLVDTKRWEMYINGFGGVYTFDLVVDISTNFPQPSYPYIDNAPEPVQMEMEISDGLTTDGGSATVTATLLDWQGHSDIKCKVESPDLFDGAVELFYTEPGPNPHEYIFTGTISNDLASSICKHDVLLAAWDINTGDHVFTEGVARVAVSFNPVDITPANLNIMAHDVFIYGNHAYVAGDIFGLHIFDITNPAQPVWVNRIETPYKASGVYVSDGYAYVADYNGGLQIIDIDPLESAYIVNSVSTTAKRIYVSDGYAYITAGSYFRIIDIDPPESAYIVKSVIIPSGCKDVSDVCVLDGYAYVISIHDGLHIIDIDPPESAYIVNSIDEMGYYNLDVDVSDGYAFVVHYVYGMGKIHILDIDPPESAHVVNVIETDNAPKGIFVSGDYAYVITKSEPGLIIMNVEQPESAYVVGSVEMPGNHAYDVYVSDGYAYVADLYTGLLVLDIDPPESPHVIGMYGSPARASDTYISGGYMYVADYYFGLLIYDISSPGSADYVNSVNTPDDAQEVFVSDGYAYVANKREGLQIIDIDPPESAYIAGSVEIAGYTDNVYVSGDYAYMGNWPHDSLIIVDINPPESAYKVKTVSFPGGLINDVYVSGGYAYVGSYIGGVHIVDVDPPESAYIVNTLDFGGSVDHVFEYNGYAIITESSYVPLRMTVVDIDPPESAYVVKSLPMNSKVIDICVSGGYLCMTCVEGGLIIVDIDPPELAYKIIVIDLEEPARDVCVSGKYLYTLTQYKGMRIYELW